MKSIKLVVLSALVAGLQVPAAQAAFPSDADASYDLPAIESYAERMARNGDANGAEVWGVSQRHGDALNPFPSRGGPVDD